MPVDEGFITTEQEASPCREDGDTAELRTTIDASAGAPLLEQRVIRFDPGQSKERSNDGRQEVLYVVAGRGTLHLGGESYALEADMGVFIAPGERYTVENPGPDLLHTVSVTAPVSDLGIGPDRRVTVRYADREPLPATSNREFRYLVNQDAGCLDITQFVGVIPPSKAPHHTHDYDEVVYVIEGEGVLHLGGAETPMGPGTCIHLPPRTRHSLENVGSGNMRVLGVFHPSGDPSRAYIDNK
jgi:mannose-6-phosphate isomerase-like protein (cupin superfamily)